MLRGEFTGITVQHRESIYVNFGPVPVPRSGVYAAVHDFSLNEHPVTPPYPAVQLFTHGAPGNQVMKLIAVHRNGIVLVQFEVGTSLPVGTERKLRLVTGPPDEADLIG